MRPFLSIRIRTGQPALLASIACAFLCACAVGQSEKRWRSHDLTRPRPPVVTPAAQALPVPAPADAVVLFDGTSLDAWRSGKEAARWTIDGDAMIGGGGKGNLATARSFGDIQLHVEWASPLPVSGDSQGRGNSGVYLMGLYEVQVLDSYDNDTYPDGQAGSIYGQYPPLVNACRPPGEWQTYDIVFRRPRFDRDGGLVSPARITVMHNGILVQDAVELWGGSSWLSSHPYRRHADRLPLTLQDHGNPVRFRNIWLRELNEEKPPAPPPLPTAIEIRADQLDRYVGDYPLEDDPKQIYSIERADGRLQLKLAWKPVGLLLIPQSETEFALRDTAAEVIFELGEDGRATALRFLMGTTDYRAIRNN